jgi:uncharacterized protein (DUF58 family)
VTRHGIIFTSVAISTTSIGVLFRWQEFLLIGLLFLLVLLTSALFVVYSPPSFVASRQQMVSTTRTIETEFMVDVESRRKRGLFVQFASGPLPYRSIPVPRQRGKRTVRVGIDTQSRCDMESGPIQLVVSDAFGFFRRSIGSCNSVRIVVQPRVFDVPSPISSRSRGDNDEGRLTGWGSQLSELVTEYNLGDEPRRIHWRTSAKVGKLMVRKELSPERTDVMLCLDTDAGSYSTTSAFASAREAFDFELFHELFASLALAEAKSGKSVRVLTTGNEPTFDLRHGMTAQFLHLMANTELIQSGAQRSENLVKSARLYKPRQLLFVTAKPNKSTLNALSELRKTTTITVIGCNMTPDVGGVDLDTRSIHVAAS